MCLIECYNISMSRHHFADWAKRDPKGFKQTHDDMWNTFVSATHRVGLSKFFSFTPDFVPRTKSLTAADATFKPGEIIPPTTDN